MSENELPWTARHIGVVGGAFCVVGLVSFYWGIMDGTAAVSGVGGVLVGLGIGMLHLNKISDVLEGLATGELVVVDADEVDVDEEDSSEAVRSIGGW